MTASRRPSTYATATWLFLRLLGLIYLFAFWSLALQIFGLIGSDGILPAREFMDSARTWADVNGIGIDRYRLVPTLCWFSTSDVFLQALSFGGAALGALVALGIAPIVLLPLLWIGYLSLNVVSGEFLSYQWDALLLETGLLAMVIAPVAWRHRLRDAADAPRIARWLLWWLLFRLMFGSGIVKLASGDPMWRDLTAMAVHFETQPLPTPLAWYASLPPLAFDKASTVMVFAIELVVPLLIFTGQRLRRVAACAFIALQALIALTGNYAFFNLLTIALSLMLLDDDALGRVPLLGRSVQHPAARAGWGWRSAIAAVVIAPVSAALLASQLGFAVSPAVRPLINAIDSVRSVNPYGLFAVMTPTRPEIIVEGSADGQTWRTYEFRYKPDHVNDRPRWVAPHQPRLDWQMWFAALGQFQGEPWFQAFCARLLRGSLAVTALLANNPFPDKPPRFVRATLYRYRFTDWSTRRATGAWWSGELIGPYSPVLSLDGSTGQLVEQR